MHADVTLTGPEDGAFAAPLRDATGPPGRPHHRAEAHLGDHSMSPDIYRVLAAHQQSEWWDLRDLATDLHRWQEIMGAEFKLAIPELALTLERLRSTRLGHFQPGHNGFGLRGEIAINRSYVGRQNYWRTLATLLHELLHAWQQAHGRPGLGNYHNRQFQAKALGYGLVVDRYGHTEFLPDSAFFRLLDRHGVSLPKLPMTLQPEQAGQGSSKLKKWTCGCTNVRVAIPDFRARCLKPGCGNEFHLCSPTTDLEFRRGSC